MNTVIDRANQCISDFDNGILQSQKSLIEIIRELVAEVSQAYEDGCNVGTTKADFTPEEIYIAERVG